MYQKYYFLCNWYLFHSLWWLCNRVAITFRRIPSSCFEVSETAVKYSVTTLAYMWNNGIQHIQSLAQGEEDWRNFFKVGNWMHWWFHNCLSLTTHMGAWKLVDTLFASSFLLSKLQHHHLSQPKPKWKNIPDKSKSNTIVWTPFVSFNHYPATWVVFFFLFGPWARIEFSWYGFDARRL